MPTKSRVRVTANSSDSLIVSGKRKRIKPNRLVEESEPKNNNKECPMEEEEPSQASRSTKKTYICPKCNHPFAIANDLKKHLSE